MSGAHERVAFEVGAFGRAEEKAANTVTRLEEAGRRQPFQRRFEQEPVDLDGSLERLLRKSLLPRMKAARAGAPIVVALTRAVAAEERDRFVALALAPETIGADRRRQEIQALLSDGVDVGSLCLDVLSPAARALGAAWERDAVSFVDVSLGVAEMMQFLRGRSELFAPLAARGRAAPRALITVAPGEQHCFGASLITSFLERAGWRVDAAYCDGWRDIFAQLRRRRYDVLGVSCADAERGAGLAPFFDAAREASAEKRLAILVGGAAADALGGAAAWARAVGADGGAEDAAEAVTLAEWTLAARCLPQSTKAQETWAFRRRRFSPVVGAGRESAHAAHAAQAVSRG